MDSPWSSRMRCSVDSGDNVRFKFVRHNVFDMSLEGKGKSILIKQGSEDARSLFLAAGIVYISDESVSTSISSLSSVLRSTKRNG